MIPRHPPRIVPDDENPELALFRSLLIEVYNHGENGDLHRRIGEALGIPPGEDALNISPQRMEGQHCTTCQCLAIHDEKHVPDNAMSRSWHKNASNGPPK